MKVNPIITDQNSNRKEGAMPATVSAWSIPRYGAPETLTPVTRPLPEPGPTEVLIRIRASAVTRADGMMRAGRPWFARPFLGLRAPRAGLSGTGLSGEVIAVGDAVSRFRPGDAVFGEAGLKFGANATHIALDEAGVLMPKPDTLGHEEAAVMTDGPLTSWHFLHEVAPVTRGMRILILGGAGSLGSAAVQIAAGLGARVTATTSARNAGLVASLGAEEVIDYRAADPLRAGADYDVIFDTLGLVSYGAAKRALVSGGRYMSPVLSLGLLCAMLSTIRGRGKTARFAAVGLEKPARLRAGLDALLAWVAEDRFAPVMDRSYPLGDLIEAHRYVATGRKRGNVVVAS
jgi:NADPH:quinone reductase-like Zn-dependent oxidoreductase